jgi:hypothetical protein
MHPAVWIAIAVVVAGGIVGGGIAFSKSRSNAGSANKAVRITAGTTATTGAVTTSTSASSTTTTQALGQTEASSISSLLSQSSNDRSSIVSAVDEVSACQNLQGALDALNSSATSRQNLLSQLSSIPTTGLTNGTQLAEYLIGAWENSLSSDQSYAAWANDEIENGCTTNDFSDSNYEAAQSSDSASTAAKTSFANLWNPIASQYNLPTVTQSSI